MAHLIEALAALYLIGACIALYLFMTAPEMPHDGRE